MREPSFLFDKVSVKEILQLIEKGDDKKKNNLGILYLRKKSVYLVKREAELFKKNRLSNLINLSIDRVNRLCKSISSSYEGVNIYTITYGELVSLYSFLDNQENRELFN
jgi:hypothetical protein